MAFVKLKTWIKEYLTFQDLNAEIDNIYVGLNQCYLSADMVSTNTPNKGVKRDSAGNFAANEITANKFIGPLQGNVTGNVTGNADTATHATTATTANTASFASTTNGNITFQISGSDSGKFSVEAHSFLYVGRNYRVVPAGKKLVLKRANTCNFIASITFKIGISRIPQDGPITATSYPWAAPSNFYDNTPNAVIYDNSLNGADQGVMLFMTFQSTASSSINCGGDTWWLDFAIE